MQGTGELAAINSADLIQLLLTKMKDLRCKASVAYVQRETGATARLERAMQAATVPSLRQTMLQQGYACGIADTSLDEQGKTEAKSAKYKHTRIRNFVSSGLQRIGCVKDGKTLKYLGVKSFETVTDHIQKKMDCYNSHQMGKEQMSFANIELDHIKPVNSFALDLSHYTNVQPLLKEANGQKSAKWTDVDELFWRTNIQHQPDFTCTYIGSSVGASACIPPHPQPKQLDDISTCVHKHTSTSELHLPSGPSSSRLSLKERDPMVYASKKRKITERLCLIFERDAVWEHIQTL